MGSSNTDQVARQKFRKRMIAWGMDSKEIELCLEQVRERQYEKKIGILELDAPLCTRAEYVRLLRKQPHVVPKGAAALRLGGDYVPPDDKGFKPSQVDSVLQGTGRVTGASAKAVKKRKTTTKYEHDQLVGESDVQLPST